MKVAIYTIALNERQFVDKWFEASKDADYFLLPILDQQMAL
jgi:hypothetical protein